MNNKHSDHEWIYKKRWMGPGVRSALKAFPVVAISGARQVGKSTFLQNEFPDFTYRSLDDFPVFQQAKTDASSLGAGTDRVIIDEAQKAPELFSAIKLAVDRSQRRKRFLISGSANLLLMRRISESLAGRAVYFEMFPMTYAEMEGKEGLPETFFSLWKIGHQEREQKLDLVDPIPVMARGFMPPLMSLRERRDILLWWEGYVKTYLERDLRELSQVDSLIGFRKVMESLALRTGNVLNQTEIGRDTKVSQPSVYRYMNLLEVSNIIKKVPPYFTSRTKRITKSPKIFFIDPGLSIYLSGYHDEDAVRNSREVGNYFETMVFFHLKVLSELMIPKASIFFWRTTTGKEVDFILEQGKRVVACEAKLTQHPTIHDARNLLAFIEDHPHTIKGILIHAGDSIAYLHSKVVAVPWWWIIR